MAAGSKKHEGHTFCDEVPEVADAQSMTVCSLFKPGYPCPRCSLFTYSIDCRIAVFHGIAAFLHSKRISTGFSFQMNFCPVFVLNFFDILQLGLQLVFTFLTINNLNIAATYHNFV